MTAIEAAQPGQAQEASSQVDQAELRDLFAGLDTVVRSNVAQAGMMDFSRKTKSEIEELIRTKLDDRDDPVTQRAIHFVERIKGLGRGEQVVLTLEECSLLGIEKPAEGESVGLTVELVLSRMSHNIKRLGASSDGESVFTAGQTVEHGEKRHDGVETLIASRAVLYEMAVQETARGLLSDGAYWMKSGVVGSDTVPAWCLDPWKEAALKIDPAKEDKTQLQALVAADSVCVTMRDMPAFSSVVAEVAPRIATARETLNTIAVKEARLLKERVHGEREKTLEEDIAQASSKAVEAAFARIAEQKGVQFESMATVQVGEGRREALPFRRLMQDSEFSGVALEMPVLVWNAERKSWDTKPAKSCSAALANLEVCRILKAEPAVLDKAVEVLSRSMESDWTGFSRADYPVDMWEENMRNFILRCADGYAFGALQAAGVYDGNWEETGLLDQDKSMRQDATIQGALEVLFGNLNPGEPEDQPKIIANPGMKAAWQRIAITLLKGERADLYRGYFSLEKAVERRGKGEQRSRQINEMREREGRIKREAAEAFKRERKRRSDDYTSRVQDKLAKQDQNLQSLKQAIEMMSNTIYVGKTMRDMSAKALQEYVEIAYVDVNGAEGGKGANIPRMRLTQKALDIMEGRVESNYRARLEALQAKPRHSQKESKEMQQLEEELSRMPVYRAFWTELNKRLDTEAGYGMNVPRSKYKKGIAGIGGRYESYFEEADFQPNRQTKAHNRKFYEVTYDTAAERNEEARNVEARIIKLRAKGTEIQRRITVANDPDTLRAIDDEISALSGELNRFDEASTYLSQVRSQQENNLKLWVDDFVMVQLRQLISERRLFNTQR